jgi:methoxymalonate biosynthesis acyl carrier protein
MKNQIRKFILKNLTLFDDDVRLLDDDNFFELGFVNSLFALKLINYIEKQYNIKVENTEMEVTTFSTVNGICNFIARKERSRLQGNRNVYHKGL